MPSTTAMPPCIRDHRTWTLVSEGVPRARCITCGDLSVAAGHALARDLADERAKTRTSCSHRVEYRQPDGVCSGCGGA